jgi:hypothetical protein
MSERVTVRGAADALGVSQATVRRRIDKGDLDAVKTSNGKRGSVWMVALPAATGEDHADTSQDQAMLETQTNARSTADVPVWRDMLQTFMLTFIPGAFAFGILWGLSGNPILGVVAWVALWVAVSWRAGLFDRLDATTLQPHGAGD